MECGLCTHIFTFKCKICYSTLSVSVIHCSLYDNFMHSPKLLYSTLYIDWKKLSGREHHVNSSHAHFLFHFQLKPNAVTMWKMAGCIVALLFWFYAVITFSLVWKERCRETPLFQYAFGFATCNTHRGLLLKHSDCVALLHSGNKVSNLKNQFNFNKQVRSQGEGIDL